MSTSWSVRRLETFADRQLDELAGVLIDCVDGGASVSFMQPLLRDRAVAFWRGVAIEVAAGNRALLVAEDAFGICGTVQLLLSQPENQPHRADVAKMLVHRRARRQGLGAALMRAVEVAARDSAKTLLVLDTVTEGDGARLYSGSAGFASATSRPMPSSRKADSAARPCSIDTSRRQRSSRRAAVQHGVAADDHLARFARSVARR